MSTGAEALGKVGLTHNVGKRESARQDIATMGQLVQMKKQQEAEEQQAALMEQKYYEQIRQESDQMLAGDRKRINERSKNLQGQIREQIKAFGGSRAKFMAQGGMAMIGDYTRGVLESEEVATYKNNQKNLTELLDIKKKGMGHLLSARDTTSLDEYNKNGTGTITYSGLKNEVEMPPSDTIYFGEQATGSEILFYKDNYLKALGNHKIDKPNWTSKSGLSIEQLSLPEQQNELIMYSNAEGWLQRGSRTRPVPKYPNGGSNGKRTNNPGSADAIKLATMTGELQVHKTKFDRPIPLSEMSNTAIPSKSLLNNVFGGFKYKKRGTIDPSIWESMKSGGTAALTLGISTAFDDEQNNTFIPRGASDMGMSMANALFEVQNGKYDIKQGGKIENFDSDSDNFYAANGVPIKAEDITKGDYTLTGSFYGYEINAKNGNYLVVDAVDIDGKLDDERNNTAYRNDEEGQPEAMGKQAMFVTLKGKDGNTVYQKIDMQGSAKYNELAQALGKEGNDLSQEYTEAAANRDLYNQQGEKITIEEQGQADLPVPNEIFENSSDFQNMVGAYNRWGDTTMRSNLMKGFYMANFDFASQDEGSSTDLDGLINSNQFGQFLENLGLDDRIQDNRINDTDLLDLMEQRILSDNQTNGGDPKVKANNKLLITKIRNYMIKARGTQN